MFHVHATAFIASTALSFLMGLGIAYIPIDDSAEAKEMHSSRIVYKLDTQDMSMYPVLVTPEFVSSPFYLLPPKK